MKNIFILAIAVISLGLFSCENTETYADYQLNPQEALSASISDTDVISPELLASVVYAQNEKVNYQFIDLRNPNDFDNGHVPGAINIPLGKIVKAISSESPLNGNKANILYGASGADAIIAGNILKQAGFNNFYISKGSYNYIKKHIMDEFSIHEVCYNTDKALFDYAKVVATTSGGAVSNSGGSGPAVKITRKKKEASGGGCD